MERRLFDRIAGEVSTLFAGIFGGIIATIIYNLIGETPFVALFTFFLIGLDAILFVKCLQYKLPTYLLIRKLFDKKPNS